MIALILNSGMGQRMGNLTADCPKCMTKITEEDTILSWQLKLLARSAIKDVVITTGLFEQALIEYCKQLNLSLNFTFIRNPLCDTTNYIYSIFLAQNELQNDILLLHGDLVFEESVLAMMMNRKHSCMVVSSTLPLPTKDFKAVVSGTQILKVGIEFYTNAVAAQPLYMLYKKDWLVWLESIRTYCHVGMVTCYAENALNSVTDKCYIECMDIKNLLCYEVDTIEDLQVVKGKLEGRIL